ncbi:MAG: transglutaminase domain-containing protein [Desulfobacteraceae bacterium]|nr:MAG: transglutaminase domain-containing protein [Desulfobacteraceae bacterium]
MKRSIYAGTVLVFCIATILLIKYFFFKADDDKVNLSKNTIPRSVRYGFTIQNNGNRLVKTGLFRTWAPVENTATQHCENINASIPFQIVPDMLGNQMLEFVLTNIPPHGIKIISITADLTLSEANNLLEKDNPQIFLKPETYIESDQPNLIQQANSLKKDGIFETALNIHDWVAGHIEYTGYIKKDRGALYAFHNKKGDCTEYMYLFVAFCRALEIPARGVCGYVCKENSILRPAEFHNWAEFNHKGRWILSDPQNRLFQKGAENYIAMRILGPSGNNPQMNFNRFHLEGEGLSARMN